MNNLTQITEAIPDFKSCYEDLDVIQHQDIIIDLEALVVMKTREYSFVVKMHSFPLGLCSLQNI